ncbi:MAG: 4a-hydroxytetrahydrobiopterin dehydratase [Bacteroidota bacterium]|nr:4a-hydroxytetrahydrobiopterin dehydratase [Bacteroidota bacterium]
MRRSAKPAGNQLPMTALSTQEIKNKLVSFPNWKHEENCIIRELTFKNFSENFAFMTRVAMIAETLNHHPNWSGGYKNLTIKLSTHDADGVSDKDFEFAGRIEKMLQ